MFKKGFKKSEYLYGVSGKYFRHMFYGKAIKEKIRLGNELVKELSDRVFDKNEYELNSRLTAVYRAIEFNKNLLKEMNDKI